MSVESVTEIEMINDETQGTSQGGKGGEESEDQDEVTLQLPNVKILV